jgi:hypothetical protein
MRRVPGARVFFNQKKKKGGLHHSDCTRKNGAYPCRMTTTNRFSSPEAWTAAIAAEADHFRVHRYSVAGHDSLTTKSFGQARRIAQHELAAGCRVLVYAVTHAGRSALVPQGGWDRLP